MPLAQLTLAMPRHPLDDPRMAGFTDNVARINGLAARMPGHRPTLAEAKERLDHHDARGDTDFAFGWTHAFSGEIP